MASSVQPGSVPYWEKKLSFHNKTIALKILGLGILGIANAAGIAYGAYRIYPLVPRWALTAAVIAPFFVGFAGAVRIHNNYKDLPFGINEKNIPIYMNPTSVLSMVVMTITLGPFAALFNYVDRTNYGHGTVTWRICEDLKKQEFEQFVHTYGRNYRNLINNGFINPEILLNDNKNVADWLKKAIPEMITFQQELASHIAIAGPILNEDGSIRHNGKTLETTKRLVKSIYDLNEEWKGKVRKIVPDAEKQAGPVRLSWFQRTFLISQQTTLKRDKPSKSTTELYYMLQSRGSPEERMRWQCPS